MRPSAPMEIRGGILHCFGCRGYFLDLHAWENHLVGVWNQAWRTDFESIEDSVSTLSDPRRALMIRVGVFITSS